MEVEMDLRVVEHRHNIKQDLIYQEGIVVVDIGVLLHGETSTD